jgi:hypothetical protein
MIFQFSYTTLIVYLQLMEFRFIPELLQVGNCSFTSADISGCEVHYTSKFLTQPFHDGITDAFITTGDLGKNNEITKTGNRAFFSLTTATFWHVIVIAALVTECCILLSQIYLLTVINNF